MSNHQTNAAVLLRSALTGARWWRVALAVVILATAAPLLAERAVAETAVTGVRVGNHRGFTRLTLTLTGPARFRASTIGSPYRLIVELEAVEWLLSPTVGLGSGLISSLSYARVDGRARIVAALRGPAKVQKTFALRPRKGRTWRLVVDLERISKDAFDRIHGARQRRAAKRAVATAAPRVKPDRSKRADLAETGKRVHRVAPAARTAGPKGGPLIVIDPGHGGQDAGAVSPWGLQEKIVALGFAGALRGLLLASGRYRILLTRAGDTFLSLRRRYQIARKAEADLFISIHADANPFKRMRGLSVYTLSARASDRLAAAMAHRENRADLIAGVNLEDKSDPVSGILIDLVRRETMARSLRIAALVVDEGRKATKLLPKPRRSAGFAVLKAPEVPSILIELGVLTNRTDERKLRDAAHHRRVAAALVRAIDRFFKQRLRAPQTASKREKRN